jgi:transcriptional regulator with XRE-family HTH domain
MSMQIADALPQLATLGERLAWCRKRWKLTLHQAGTYTEISGPRLCNYEKNQVVPTIATLEKLADLYGVSIGVLLGREALPDRLVSYHPALTTTRGSSTDPEPHRRHGPRRSRIQADVS